MAESADIAGEPRAAVPAARSAIATRPQWMFWAGFAHLALIASLLPHHGDGDHAAETPVAYEAAALMLGALWVVMIAEATWCFLRAEDRAPAAKRLLLVALIPPFRMGVSPRRPNERVWLPWCGWLDVSAESVADLERRATIPMIVATLLILPVLIVDFGFAAAVEASPALQFGLDALMAFIWFSFALEFVVTVSLAPKKLAYCKKHWINIVIILLPLIAFLRSLQLFRFLRVAKAGKLAKAYRLRGLGQRLLKIALTLNLIERILARNPERYAASLEEKIAEAEQNLAAMREQLEQTRARIAERVQAEPGADDGR